MKKILMLLAAVAAISFTSCKTDKTGKIDEGKPQIEQNDTTTKEGENADSTVKEGEKVDAAVKEGENVDATKAENKTDDKAEENKK